MADLLAEVGELSEFIGTELNEDLERLLLELATGSVQAAAGQRIILVANDQVELLGSVQPWLPLPERPVVSVASVLVDGSAVTNFDLRGTRLHRSAGWGTPWMPSTVAVTYTHGYPDGDPGLQFAKQATLLVAAQMHANPTGATGFGIDDYREQYSQAAGAGLAGEIPQSLRRALRQRYGLGVWTLALR